MWRGQGLTARPAKIDDNEVTDVRTYIIRRLLLMIPTLWLVSLAVFLMVRLIPGDIIDALIAEQALMSEGGTVSGQINREMIEKRLGLDQPIHVQYGRWIGDMVLRGSLGVSLRGGYPVGEKIAARLPVTFELGTMSILIGLLVAIPLGTYSAIRQDTAGDYVGRSLAIIFISVPSFWIGTMIMIYPAIWWRWSPPMELIPFTKDPLRNLGMFIIPAGVLGMLMSESTMRMTRAMMLEVLRQDYIRTAWSKGLRERVVVIRHATKNALIPVVTLVGLQLFLLVGGAVIMENIFNLPGLGRLLLFALQDRDYPVVSGINLFFATAVVGINLFIDLVYAFLDPRVRYK